MTTRADIAKIAGVSESTVSYVLSGKRPISESTKKRVRAAIAQTGYKSNYAAAALAGGKPKMVTMMTSNLFLAPPSRIDGALIDGIVNGVKESGFHSVIWPVSNDDDSDIDDLLALNFSGGVILMNVVDNDPRVRTLHKAKVPFVVLGRTKVNFAYNYVDRDFETVYKISLSKLKDLSHSHIGVISGSTRVDPLLKKVADSLKLKLFWITCKNTREGGVELAKEFRANYPTVTAVISLLDIAIVDFVNSASTYGISIPQDLSIIGLNMLEEQAESANPLISTIALNAFDLAASCGKMLVEVIESGDESKEKRTELWVGDFIDRGSTTKNHHPR